MGWDAYDDGRFQNPDGYAALIATQGKSGGWQGKDADTYYGAAPPSGGYYNAGVQAVSPGGVGRQPSAALNTTIWKRLPTPAAAPAAAAPAASAPAAAPVSNPAANADTKDAFERALTAKAEMDSARPVVPKITGLEDSGIETARQFGNMINGPNGFTRKFMDWQTAQNQFTNAQNKEVTQNATDKLVSYKPNVSKAPDTAALYAQFQSDLKSLA